MRHTQDTRTTSETYHASSSYASLYDMLLAYRHANALERQGILCLAIQNLEALKANVGNDDDLALEQYSKLVEIASLIRYAKNISLLENHQDIDIFDDFKGMSLEPDVQAGIKLDLREWFEMNPDAPKIKFKKDIEAYSGSNDAEELWRSLSAARTRHVQQFGKAEFRENYQPINDFTLRDDGLFPGVFTWMAHYHNEAVDRIVYDKYGKILNMVTACDEHFLSAGGMRNTHEGVLEKAIEETIEEHYGNMHKAKILRDGNAVNLYDLIPLEDFKKEMQEIQRQYSSTIGTYDLQSLFESCVNMGSDQNIVDQLNLVITAIDIVRAQPSEKKHLLSLKASILSKLFVHTPLYSELKKYMESDMTIKRVPQLLDMRTGSGSQMTSLVLSRSFEAFINSQVENVSIISGLADDVFNASRTPKTLMQALAVCTKMKFSHLLLILEAYKYAAEKGDLYPSFLWNPAEFQKTRQAMIQDIKQYLLKPQQLSAQGASIINKLLIKAKISPELCSDINQRLSNLMTHIENGVDPKEAIAEFDRFILQIIKSKKISDLIKALLWVMCAGLLITAGGFGLGFMLGIWATPAAFFALMSSNPIVLSLCAVMTVSIMGATAYKQFGLFANNDKLYKQIKSVEENLAHEIANYFTYST